MARMPCCWVQCPWSWWVGRLLRMRSSRDSWAVKVRLCGWKLISASLVVEPLTDEWEPGFVDRFFGAEQQPVPVRAVRSKNRGEVVAFGGGGDEVEDAVGKRCVGFGVDTDRGDLRVEADRGCGVAGAVGHAAPDSGRPGGCAADAGQDRGRRVTQPRQAGPGAAPDGGVLTAS